MLGLGYGRKGSAAPRPPRCNEGVPAQHHQIEGHRTAPIELPRAPKDVFVRVSLNTAIEELVAGREPIEQARPAASKAEHDGITPDDRQLAAGIERIALQADLIYFEGDRAVIFDEDE